MKKSSLRKQTITDYFKSHPKFQQYKYDNKSKQLPKLPNEILLKIFDYLSASDLLKCSQVCTVWHTLISTNRSVWMKWSKTYKCQNEYAQLLNEGLLTPNQCFHKLIIAKIQLELFRKREKLTKRKNLYTGLVDFKSFLGDFDSLIWTMELLDKNGKLIYGKKSNEQNNFESSFSVLWYSFSDLDEKMTREVTSIRIYAQIPISLDMRNEKVEFKDRTDSKLVLRLRGVMISEIDGIRFDRFKKPTESNEKMSYPKIDEISTENLINLYQVNQNYLFGLWNSESSYNKGDSLAFVTLNSIFDNNFVEKIFGQSNFKGTNKSLKSKSSLKSFQCVDLDGRFGLGDYKVYMCFRNQTKSTFFTLSQTVYKAAFTTINGKRCIHLNVLDSDMKESVGLEIKMMPKFSWRTDIFTKNTIDLLAIVDFCLFDRDLHLIETNSFPVKFSKMSISKKESSSYFISDLNYQFNYVHQYYSIAGEINCLKDEFTYSGNGESYHLVKLDIYLYKHLEPDVNNQDLRNRNSKLSWKY